MERQQFDIRISAWNDDWLVIARERIGAVVSVQFHPAAGEREKIRPPRIRARELEPA